MMDRGIGAGFDLDLADIWRMLVRARFWIAGSAILCCAIAAILAFKLPPVYTADTVLLASNDEQSGGLQGLASIASKVGLGGLGLIPDGGADRKVEAVATLQSRALTEKYILDNELMPVLFESNWDPVRKRWKGDDPAQWPTAWAATELFRNRIRTITEDRRTGLITLSIHWKDKDLAAKWANELVARANAYLQQAAIDRSTRNLDYLQGELKRDKTLDIQQSINNLMEAEINRAMLARGSDQYAFRVVDPAVVPQDSQLKRQVMMVLSGLALGAVGAVLIAFLFNAIRGKGASA